MDVRSFFGTTSDIYDGAEAIANPSALMDIDSTPSLAFARSGIFINIPQDKYDPNMEQLTELQKTYCFLIGFHAFSLFSQPMVCSTASPSDSEEYFQKRMEAKNLEQQLIKSFYEERIQQETESLQNRIIALEKELLCKEYQSCNSLKEKINGLEKELIRKEQYIQYQEETYTNKLELGIHQKYQEFQNTINQLEKQLITKEAEMKILENERIQQEILKNEKLMEDIVQLNERISYLTNESNTKAIDTLTKKIEDIEKTSKNAKKGRVGENIFHDLVLETFCKYDQFEIKRKSTLSHSGDFFLMFKDYTILADSKYFTESVGISTTDINKLNKDMKHNQQIKIAWLVSLDKPILKHAEYPYTIKIDEENGICYCYINSLLTYENPGLFLELVWYHCHLIHKYILTNRENENDLLEKYKRKEEKIRTIMEKMKKMAKERMAMLNQLRANFEETERDIMEALNSQIMDIRNIHSVLVENWWKEHLEKTTTATKVIRTNLLYEKFIQSHNGNGIDIDMFKQILRGFLEPEDIAIGKSEKSQYQIMNYKWK